MAQDLLHRSDALQHQVQAKPRAIAGQNITIKVDADVDADAKVKANANAEPRPMAEMEWLWWQLWRHRLHARPS